MNRLRTVLAAACLAMATTVAHADIKGEPLPAAETVGKPIRFSSHEKSVAETIEQFVKQTHLPVVYENQGGNPISGPEILYDVDIKDLPASDAIRELARSLGLGVSRDGEGGVRLSPNSWSSDNDRRPEPAVLLGYIRRTQSFPAYSQQPDSLQLQFRIWSGKSPLSGQVKIKLDEATDDTGRSLLRTERDQSVYFDDFPRDRYVTDQSVNLQFPDPKPKKIATLKGSALIAKPKTILRITADKLMDGAQNVEYAGGTLTISQPKKEGSGYSFKISLKRKLANEERQMFYNRLRTAQTAAVFGPDGQALRLQHRGGSMSDREASVDLYAQPPRQPNGSEGPAFAPASLQWDSVVETVDDVLPFTLTNIDIP